MKVQLRCEEARAIFRTGQSRMTPAGVRRGSPELCVVYTFTAAPSLIGKECELVLHGEPGAYIVGECYTFNVELEGQAAEKPKHCCGLMGFDPMKGDVCPACRNERTKV